MGEAFIVRRGGGGGGTKLMIRAYPVGTDIATISGKDGLVAVITDTPINSWAVSATEPTNAANGTVWIVVDNVSNETNILSKNVLNVYPSICKQFVDGVWKNLAAYICHGSNWVQFGYARLYLFEHGKGINKTLFNNFNTTFGPGAIQKEIAIDENQITVTPNTNNCLVAFCTDQQINLSGFSKIGFRYKGGSAAQGGRGFALAVDSVDLSAWPGGYTTPGSSYPASFYTNTAYPTYTELYCDFGTVTNGYVKLLSWEQPTEAFSVTDIWLE